MSQTCTICTHPDRKAIESALVAGVGVRVIASRFVPLTRSSIQRHKEDHLPSRLAKAQDARESANADELLRQVKGLQGKAASLLLQAEKAGDLKTALAGVRESRGCIELLAKLMGELDERPQFNVIINPQWIELRAVIVQALEPYPDAGKAVAAALNGAPS
jgi:hypothetical protein